MDVAVIGAGQAGLSTAYWLRRRGVAPFVVLDAESRAGGAWQHRWPSLRVGTTHRIHSLPGLDVPDADPARPASELMGEYFAAYERTFELPVRRPVQVTAVRRADDRLLVAAGEQAWAARAVVNATGTWRSPSCRTTPASRPSPAASCTRPTTGRRPSSPACTCSSSAAARPPSSSSPRSPASRGRRGRPDGRRSGARTSPRTPDVLPSPWSRSGSVRGFRPRVSSA